MRSSYYLGKPEEECCEVDPQPGTNEARELDIRLLAYDLWQEDERPPGDGWNYWLRAEQWWREEWDKRSRRDSNPQPPA